MKRLRDDPALQLRLVRVWLPLLVVVVGIAFMVVATDLAGLEGGALIVSAGISIWLLNWLYRVGIAGEGERQAEDDAREFYARHGHWPDEAPAAGARAAPPAPSPAAPAPAPAPREDPHRAATERRRLQRTPRRRG